jgi:hypothetical protein
MNVPANTPKRQFIMSFQVRALYLHGGELLDLTLISV